MAATTTVEITLVGVRLEHLPRLRTAIKTHLTRYGTTIDVDDGTAEGEDLLHDRRIGFGGAHAEDEDVEEPNAESAVL